MNNLKFVLLVVFLPLVLLSCNETQTGPYATTDEGISLKSPSINKGKGGKSEPKITSISSTSAEIGDLLTITGNNFSNKRLSKSGVSINGITATVYKKWSSTEIQVIVPSGASSSSGYVTVFNGSKTSNQVDFTILTSSPVTIGTQTWMGYNLDVSHYRNGDEIRQVTDATEWDNLTTGAWCYFNNDESNGPLVGKLYNWYAVNDSRGLAPEGWHVPTDAEFKTLSMYIGMSQEEADQYGYDYFGTTEGGKLKEEGTNLWLSYNYGATNEYGFTALPGGMRSASVEADFSGINSFNGMWSSSNFNDTSSWMRGLDRARRSIYRNYLNKNHGFSVRCIKD